MGLELCLLLKNVVPGPSKDAGQETHPTWQKAMVTVNSPHRLPDTMYLHLLNSL